MAKQKRWLVIPREKATALKGMVTSFGRRKFHHKTGVTYVSSKAEAEEIDHKYGMKGRRDVMVFEDERYSHALNAESWEMKRDNRTGGDYVKTLHHYSQLVHIELPILTLKEKLKKLMRDIPFRYWLFHYWNYINNKYEREVGIRIFGKEFVWTK